MYGDFYQPDLEVIHQCLKDKRKLIELSCCSSLTAEE